MLSGTCRMTHFFVLAKSNLSPIKHVPYFTSARWDSKSFVPWLSWNEAWAYSWNDVTSTFELQKSFQNWKMHKSSSHYFRNKHMPHHLGHETSEYQFLKLNATHATPFGGKIASSYRTDQLATDDTLQLPTVLFFPQHIWIIITSCST